MCNINIEVDVLRKNQNEVLNVKTNQNPEIKYAFDGLISRLSREESNGNEDMSVRTSQTEK